MRSAKFRLEVSEMQLPYEVKVVKQMTHDKKNPKTF